MRRTLTSPRAAAGFAALVLIILAACSLGSLSNLTGPTNTVASVTLTADSLVGDSLPVVAGDSTQLTATAVDAQGQPVAGATLVWSSSDTTVATVSSTGLVKSVDLGEADVTVAVGASSSVVGAVTEAHPTAAAEASRKGVVSTRGAASRMKVYSVPRIVIKPQNPTINVGDMIKFSAKAVKADGTTPDWWRVGSRHWRSSVTSVGTIDGKGNATGVSAGKTRITVTMTVNTQGFAVLYSKETTLTVTGCGVASVLRWNVNEVVSTYNPGTISAGQGASYTINQTSTATGGDSLKQIFNDADSTIWHGTVTGTFAINNSFSTTTNGQVYKNTEIGNGSLSPKADVTLKVYHSAGATCTYWMEYSDLATYTATSALGIVTIDNGLLGNLNLVANVPAPPANGQPWVLTGGGASLPVYPLSPIPAKGTYYEPFTDLSMGAAFLSHATAVGKFQFTANPNNPN